jgi:protease PrsW
MFLWAVILWWLDRFEKEPILLLGLAFFWGAAPAAAFSMISEFVLDIPLGMMVGNHSQNFILITTGFVGPVMEEICKMFGILCLFFVARSEIDGPLDGILYAAFVGLGFTATENLLYFLSSQSVSEWLGLVMVRTMVFGLNHAVFAALVGYGLAVAWNTKGTVRRLFWFFGGFCAAVFFHILFNLSVITLHPFPASFLTSLLDTTVSTTLVVVLFLLGLRYDQMAIRQFLPRFVEEGLINAEELTIVLSIPQRLFYEGSALLKLNTQKYRQSTSLFNLYAELALKEKQKAIYGYSFVRAQKIAKITGKILQLKQAMNSKSTRLV